MARHGQTADPSRMTCTSCKSGKCSYCVDVTRTRAGLTGALCKCERVQHAQKVIGALDG